MNEITWMTTSGDASTVITLFSVCALLLAVTLVISYQYRRWVAHRSLALELQELSFDETEQATFFELVMKHAAAEQVTVLHSLPVFDSIAQTEIERVLASPATREAKEAFIEHVYSIRLKAFCTPDEEQIFAA